jgi:hypothetical protein
VHAVLDRLGIGDRHEAHADGRVLVGADDDLVLALAQYLPAKRLRPEPGQAQGSSGVTGRPHPPPTGRQTLATGSHTHDVPEKSLVQNFTRRFRGNARSCRGPCLLLQRRTRRGIYSGRVLDLSSFDLEEIGNALADQTDYEHRWLINPQSGEIAFWTAMSAPSAGRSNGWPTIRSSMTMLPAASWPGIQIPICPDPLMTLRNGSRWSIGRRPAVIAWSPVLDVVVDLAGIPVRRHDELATQRGPAARWTAQLNGTSLASE